MKTRKIIIAAALTVFCIGMLYAVSKTQETPPVPTAAQTAALEIPSGWRGVFMEVPGYMAEKIQKGSLVDILLTFTAVSKEDKGTPQNLTATIFQKVKVLESGRGFLVLALDPRDAQYFYVAQREGQLNLILRNEKDKETPALKVASIKSLFE